jgi:hypothetical protein
MGKIELANRIPVQFLFNMLSFVAQALWQIIHNHTLIFKRILLFHMFKRYINAIHAQLFVQALELAIFYPLPFRPIH